jgi:hypothetical protein
MAFQFDFTALKHPLVVEALTLKLNDVLHGYALAVPGAFALVESLDVGSEVRCFSKGGLRNPRVRRHHKR